MNNIKDNSFTKTYWSTHKEIRMLNYKLQFLFKKVVAAITSLHTMNRFDRCFLKQRLDTLFNLWWNIDSFKIMRFIETIFQNSALVRWRLASRNSPMLQITSVSWYTFSNFWMLVVTDFPGGYSHRATEGLLISY